MPHPAPAPANDWLLPHATLLASSYRRLTGHALLACETFDREWAGALYAADFALLSHGTEADPLFNYANACALRLFELDWPTLLVTPSRASAESTNQAAREAFMQEVRTHGYAENYSGVRISARGRRFVIDNATVWNVISDDGSFRGQAACFPAWRRLDP